MRIFITGDSHTGALKRGLDALQSAGASPAGFEIEIAGLAAPHLVGAFFEDAGSAAVIIEPEYRKRFPQLPLPGAKERDTVYCWCGLFHFARLWRNGSWIRFRPASMPGPGIPVSSGVIAGMVRHWFKHQLALVDVLHRNGVRILAVESPRPFRHHPALRLIRPQVATAVDRLCKEVMLAELRGRSVELIGIPPQCVDAEGFMRPQWRHEKHDDPHHGNAEFGALMIERICEVLQGEIDG